MTEPVTNTECLLRGGRDRPVRLFVDSFDTEVAALKPTNRAYDKPLCFARERVFELDGDLLERLRECSDASKMEEIWRRARLWQPNESEV